VTVVAAASPGTPRAVPPWLKLVPEPQIDRLSEFESYRHEFSSRVLHILMDSMPARGWHLVHSQEWFGAEAAVEISKRFEIPHVKTVHFVPPLRLLDQSPRWRAAHHWQRVACNAADHIIAVGQLVSTEAVREFEIPVNKLSVIHNGVDPSGIAMAAQVDELSDYAPDLTDHKTKIVVLSGRLAEQKGIDILLATVPIVLKNVAHPVRWIICGGSSGGDPVLSYYRSLAAPYGDYVTFTGHIPRADALGLVKRADVVVAPSRFEPFGLSVLEAMHLAKPIIASGVGGHRELIVDGVSGILLPVHDAGGGWEEVSISALAEAQCRLLRTPEMALSYGQNASQRASQMFSFDRFIQRTIDVYKSLM
jgi:glycosyltransferase involved in cell wall biosynthesis